MRDLASLSRFYAHRHHIYEAHSLRYLVDGAGDGGVCVSRVFVEFHERLTEMEHNRWTKVSELNVLRRQLLIFRQPSQEDHEIFDIVSALEASEGSS